MNINEFKKLSTIKPKNDPNAWMDEPIKAEKWRNLNFTKDGDSHFGVCVYDTEQAAKDRAEYAVQRMIAGFSGAVETPDGGSIPFEHLSHTIQIPVKS